MQRAKLELEAVADLAGIVTHHAPVAEHAGRPVDAVVDALHESGLVRVLLPAAHGGASLTLADAFPVFEAMARVDGAAGWNLAIGASSLAIATCLDDDAFRCDVLDDPRALVAGSFNPAGLRARPATGGFIVDGTLTFVSGGSHASWLVAIASVHDQYGPVVDATGVPSLVAAFLPPGDASPLDTWHVAGMRGTGSNDWRVDDVFVPSQRTLTPARFGRGDHEPMAMLPLFSVLGASLAFVAVGVACHAIDMLVQAARTKVAFVGQQRLRERADVQIAVARARGLVEAGRAGLMTAWLQLERAVLGGTPPGPEQLASLRLAMVTATDLAATAVDLVQRAAGTEGLFEAAGIERCWRDVHAVTQHAMVSTRHLDRIGRIALGLPAGPGPI